jgi:hypothetical protein
MEHKNKSGGFIKIIIIIVVIVVLLAYFNVNLRELLSSETTEDNVGVLRGIGEAILDGIIYVWENYVKEPALWVWQEAVLEWLWPLVSGWLESQKNS